MKNFVDRTEETETLEQEYLKHGASFVVVYGRRRVGKTALISEFIRGKNALFFLATEENERNNQHNFSICLERYTNGTFSSQKTAGNWDTLFEAFVKYNPADSADCPKKILVIDEFQYLCKANKAFSSILQRIWELKLKNENIMLILCGSHLSMMESEVLNYSSPLYGRRTAQILLRQVPFRYYSAFYPHKNKEQLCQFYSVTGGVPKYIEQFEGFADIFEAIDQNILKRTTFLYDEPNFLLRNELGEVGVYFSIIKSVAAGCHKLSKIAEVMEEKQSTVSAYLQTLISLDIIRREVPVTEDHPDKSKKGLYKIKDNFILFWFKFIYPNISLIESGQRDIVLAQIRENFIVNHVSHIYEDICIEELHKINGSKQLGFVYNKYGHYWDDKNEIDIVAFNSAGNEILFGECKFRNRPMDTDVLLSLRKKAASVKWNMKNRIEKYVLFSISGYTEALQKCAQNDTNVILM